MKRPQRLGIELLLDVYEKTVYWAKYLLLNGQVQEFLLFGRSEAMPVIVLPLTRDDEVVAVYQFRYGSDCFVLELPGGCPKGGELEKAVVARELLAETGFRSEAIVRLSDNIWFEPAASGISYVPFLALDCQKVQKPKLDDSEVMENRLIPWDKWVRMIYRGEVKDSKSIAITMLAQGYKNLL